MPRKFLFSRLFAIASLALAAAPAAAQIRTVDPNDAMQADTVPVPSSEATYGTAMPEAAPAQAAPASTIEPPFPPPPVAQAQPGTTFQKNDVISAAEGVFGKGAEGLAKMIESILSEQGEPNAYIAGREAGGALVVGLRYGSGTMHHKVEGERPVYWTGPSVGFDVGANGAKTFVLVYNLYDSQDVFKRFPAAEGNIYVIGGLTASYLRRGDIVLIPIRLGVGWRLGVNAGYMKITQKSRIIPF